LQSTTTRLYQFSSRLLEKPLGGDASADFFVADIFRLGAFAN